MSPEVGWEKKSSDGHLDGLMRASWPYLIIRYIYIYVYIYMYIYICMCVYIYIYISRNLIQTLGLIWALLLDPKILGLESQGFWAPSGSCEGKLEVRGTY